MMQKHQGNTPLNALRSRSYRSGGWQIRISTGGMARRIRYKKIRVHRSGAPQPATARSICLLSQWGEGHIAAAGAHPTLR